MQAAASTVFSLVQFSALFDSYLLCSLVVLHSTTAAVIVLGYRGVGGMLPALPTASGRFVAQDLHPVACFLHPGIA